MDQRNEVAEETGNCYAFSRLLTVKTKLDARLCFFYFIEYNPIVPGFGSTARPQHALFNSIMKQHRHLWVCSVSFHGQTTTCRDGRVRSSNKRNCRGMETSSPVVTSCMASGSKHKEDNFLASLRFDVRKLYGTSIWYLLFQRLLRSFMIASNFHFNFLFQILELQKKNVGALWLGLFFQAF